MPKLFGREVHPVVIIGGIVVAVWLGVGAMQAPPTATVTKKKPVASNKTATEVDYTKGDYTTVFLPLTASPGDAFRPLISKGGLGDVKANQSIDNFSYSGMATLSGQANGLLENSTTGQGDFVTPGQRWHQNWLVVSITADEISLKNVDTSETTTLKAGANEKAAPSPGAGNIRNGGGGNQPFNPAMYGQIGGDMTIQADQSNTTIDMSNGAGRRRGGRAGGGGRGRGGRGGGQAAGDNGGN